MLRRQGDAAFRICPLDGHAPDWGNSQTICRRYWRKRPNRRLTKARAAVPLTPLASHVLRAGLQAVVLDQEEASRQGKAGATLLPAGGDGDGGCRAVPGGG